MSGLNFISADQRLAENRAVNIALFGPSGIGKTSQLLTLPEDKTLFLDLEAGGLAVQEWAGTSIDVRAEAQRFGIHPWKLCQALACLLGGPDPAAQVGDPYHADAHAMYVANLGDHPFGDFDTIFVDSITVASRWSFAYWGGQPEAISEKTGKKDPRGQYGAHGRDMVDWLTVLQHQPKSIIVVGILDKKTDNFERVVYEPQIVGGMAGRELPGIFDQIITMNSFDYTDAATGKLTQYRGFVCRQLNEYGYPAKDRSGRLDVLEPPDLGRLIQKIKAKSKRDKLITSIPKMEGTT